MHFFQRVEAERLRRCYCIVEVEEPYRTHDEPHNPPRFLYFCCYHSLCEPNDIFSWHVSSLHVFPLRILKFIKREKEARTSVGNAFGKNRTRAEKSTSSSYSYTFTRERPRVSRNHLNKYSRPLILLLFHPSVLASCVYACLYASWYHDWVLNSGFKRLNQPRRPPDTKNRSGRIKMEGVTPTPTNILTT